MAKLSLPKLEFDKKKAGIAGGALQVVDTVQIQFALIARP
jgi:hypothetical protein